MAILWQDPTTKEQAMQRVLRGYRRVARDYHWCDRCCTHIVPGEEYEARVDVMEDRKKHRIVVWKYHADWSCDWPPDPDDDWDRDEAEDDVHEELPLAA